MSAAPPQPYQWNKVFVPFTGGVDTRSDRKTVQVPKLGLLENAVFTTPNALRKRYGMSSLPTIGLLDYGVTGSRGPLDVTISGARKVFVRNQELLLATDSRLYSHAPFENRFVARGACPLLSVKYRRYLDQVVTNGDIRSADIAVTSTGVVLVAYEAWNQGSSTIYVSVMDGTTGTLTTPLVVNTGISPRLLSYGTSAILFYVNTGSPGFIQALVFDPMLNAVGQTPFLPVVIASDGHTTVPLYDAEVSGGRFLICYNTATANQLKWGYITTSGALDGAFTAQATSAAPVAVGVAVEPTSRNFALCWASDAAAGTATVRMFNDAGTALFASTDVGSGEGGNRRNITAVFNTATVLDVFYELDPAGVTYTRRVVRRRINTAGALGGPSVWITHSGLASKPWVDAGDTYVTVAFQSPLQPTFFVLRVGKDTSFGSTVALTTNLGQKDPTVCARVFPGTAAGVTDHAHLPHVTQIGRQVLVPLLDRLSKTIRRLRDVVFDHAANGDHHATHAGYMSYITGGFLSQYDGSAFTESGFLCWPESIVATPSAAGGALLQNTSYSYVVVLESYTATGERQLSAASPAITVTTGAGQDTVTLTIQTMPFTNRLGGNATNFVVYRFGQGGQGLVAYRVSSADPSASGSINAFTANNFIGDTVTFIDKMAEATMLVNEVSQKSAGVLDSIAPPSSKFIAAGNFRTFLSGFEDPNLIWASKLRGFGESLSWSDVITIVIPDADELDPITGIAALGDSLIVFRSGHMYIVGGDGPDNTGKNGSFMPPRVISDDIGCPYPASIVRLPIGLMFMSKKGIYLLGGDMSLGYIGGDVEQYNGEIITAALSLPDVHEARFVCASGKTLVFNYLAKQWSVFTGVGGLDACLWQGRCVVLYGSTGVVRVETKGSFLDAGQSYSWALETAWIHLGAMQEHLRLRKLMVLAEWMGQHSLQVKIAYNYELAFTDIITVDISSVVSASKFGDDVNFGDYSATVGGTMGGNVGAAAQGLVSTQVYQFRIFPRRTRCESLKLRFEEQKRIDPAGVIDYPLLEGIRLNEIAIEVGQRGGLWQPGADRSFGG